MKPDTGDIVKIGQRVWGVILKTSTDKFWRKTMYLVETGKGKCRWITETLIKEIQYALRAPTKAENEVFSRVIKALVRWCRQIVGATKELVVSLNMNRQEATFPIKGNHPFNS